MCLLKQLTYAQQDNHWVVQSNLESFDINDSPSVSERKTVFFDIDRNAIKPRINKIDADKLLFTKKYGIQFSHKMPISPGYHAISNNRGQLLAFIYLNVLYNKYGDSIDYIPQIGGLGGIAIFVEKSDNFTIYFIRRKEELNESNFEDQYEKTYGVFKVPIDTVLLIEAKYSGNNLIKKHTINFFTQYARLDLLQSNLVLFITKSRELKLQFVWNCYLHTINISQKYTLNKTKIIFDKYTTRIYDTWNDDPATQVVARPLIVSPNGRFSLFTWNYISTATNNYDNSELFKFKISRVILVENNTNELPKIILEDSNDWTKSMKYWNRGVFLKCDSVFIVPQSFQLSNQKLDFNESIIEVTIKPNIVQIKNCNIRFLNKYIDNSWLIKTNRYFKDFTLGSDGQVYVLVTEKKSILNWQKDDRISRQFLFAKLKKIGDEFTLDNPVKIFEGVSSRLKAYNRDHFIEEQIYFPQTPGTYHKIDFTSKSICYDLTYKFTNHSDTSWFDHYKWFWGDGDSSYSNNKTPNILHQFKKAGTYEVLLRAYNPEGGSVWYTDSVIILPEPIAKFGTKNTIGCQWIAVSFADSSLLQNKAHTWRWDFGDGTDTSIGSTNNIMPKNKSIKHTYTTSGKFNVQLQVSDGRCIDTFNAIQNISILPAPRPGIAIDKTTGCTPLEVQFGRIYSDPTDSTIYHFKPALVPINRFSGATNKTIMVQSGRFTLIQKLYGPSGCITQDSVKMNITPGIPVGYLPELKRSTVLNNRTTLTEWKPVPHAKYYQVYRNGLIHDVVNDTIFRDYLSSEINQSYTYEIRAKDSCDNFGGNKSNIGKTIYLNVKEIEPVIKSNFSTALLTWTPYEDWSSNGGVKEYECLGTYDLETANWQPLTNLNDTQFNDKNFIQPKKFEKCFVVKARSGNQAYESQSNSYCLPYQATLFAPSAFTPNGDGLNDEFNIFNYGFDKFTLTIFNSWGQKLFEQNNSEGTWKPEKDVPQGVYVYYVKAYRKGVEYTFTNTVTLLK